MWYSVLVFFQLFWWLKAFIIPHSYIWIHHSSILHLYFHIIFLTKPCICCCFMFLFLLLCFEVFCLPSTMQSNGLAFFLYLVPSSFSSWLLQVCDLRLHPHPSMIWHPILNQFCYIHGQFGLVPEISHVMLCSYASNWILHILWTLLPLLSYIILFCYNWIPHHVVYFPATFLDDFLLHITVKFTIILSVSS